ncbi:hypothetical protein [Intrasporangium sp.]|uniref:hypothetical protein n=1 Tax=Intrasporangium sp. TaxID=1925024 RepID=UPI0032221301
MRTTLDLDDRVLTAARARARASGVTLGSAVSELALAGLEAEQQLSGQKTRSGLVLLPSTPGQVITDAMVADALVEE